MRIRVAMVALSLLAAGSVSAQLAEPLPADLDSLFPESPA